MSQGFWEAFRGAWWAWNGEVYHDTICLEYFEVVLGVSQACLELLIQSFWDISVADNDRQRQTETDRARHRRTKTDRDRHRQTHGDRHRQADALRYVCFALAWTASDGRTDRQNMDSTVMGKIVRDGYAQACVSVRSVRC